MSYKTFVPYYWLGLLSFIATGVGSLLLGRFVSPGDFSRKWRQGLKAGFVPIDSMLMGLIWCALTAMEISAGFLTWNFMMNPVISESSGDISMVDIGGAITETQAEYVQLALALWLSGLFVNTFYDPLMTLTRSKFCGGVVLALSFGAEVTKDAFMFLLSWQIGLIGLFMPLFQFLVLVNLYTSVETVSASGGGALLRK